MKKRKDGRYVKMVDGVLFYGATEREVYRKIMDFTEKKASGAIFADVAEAWWRDTYESLAAQTLKVYKPAFEEVLNFFARETIKDITPRDISIFLKTLATRKLAYKTIANRRTVLNQIFNYAILQGHIQFNPCASAQLPRNLTKETRLPATESEEQKILESDHPWLFPLFALLTGLRKGEILALQWEDIDFERKTITVTKSIEYLGNVPHVKAPKTAAGVRIVPLLDKLAERLKPMQCDPKHFVFSETNGATPITNKRYHTMYTQYQQEVGITATAHQLRHSYATVAVEAGVDPKALQNALGHTTITMTMDIYAKARKRAITDVADKLNSMYSVGIRSDKP